MSSSIAGRGLANCQVPDVRCASDGTRFLCGAIVLQQLPLTLCGFVTHVDTLQGADPIFKLSARARFVLMLPAIFQLTLGIPFATTLQAHEHRETRTPIKHVAAAHRWPGWVKSSGFGAGRVRYGTFS